MKKAGVILLFILAAGFVYGLLHLFKLRFETGDIYPPYSSFRTDPLGTKALYESFDDLLGANRNFKPFPRIESGGGTTLFVLGIQPKQLEVTPLELKELEHYMMTGGRLVLSFFPIYTPAEVVIRPPPPGPGQPAKQPARRREKEQDFGILLSEQWKFELNHAALARDKDQKIQPEFAVKTSKDDLPGVIACHTALCFDKLHPAWRVIYRRTNDCAVLIERKFGSGSIIMAADSYPFSNEALLKEREPKLLAWFGGGVHTVIFDETHLGVQESRGVAALARKYRLHGFAAAVLLLAALFIWRYSFSLVPPYEKEFERGDLIAGKEAGAGFTNLLRRNLSSRELLKVCLEEWNKSCRHRVPLPRLEKVQSVIDRQNALPERERDPVATYRQITEALARTAPKKS